MMVDAGDPGTAEELVAGALSRYVVERIGPSHLAIRADDVRGIEAALRTAGHELQAGLDRVSGRLGDREPRRTEAEAMWEPEAAGAPPPGRQISTLTAEFAVPEASPAPPRSDLNGGLGGGPDRQDDPIDAVLDAIECGTDLLIVYAGARDTTLRQITPYDVEGAALRAYCHKDGEERSFWLASIQEAVALN